MAKVRFTVKPSMLGRFEEKLARNLRKKRVHAALLRAGKEVVLYLRVISQPVFYRGAYRTGWVALGRGSASMVITNTAPNFNFVEDGRKPGKTPPPIGPILTWVLSKGMAAGAAFPIARAIGRRGIKARPLFTTEQVQRTTEKIVQSHLLRFLDKVLLQASR